MDAWVNTRDGASGSVTAEQVTADFARSWEEGNHPSIEQFISTFEGDEVETLLLRLIAIEVTYQIGPAGEVDVETYVSRFPEYAELIRDWFSSHLDLDAGAFLGSTIGLPRIVTSDPETQEFRVQVLGRYELREFIGSGGFGEVWRAHDPQLRREVAIKTPRGNRWLSSELRHQFVAEGRKAARLQHPGIVRVYDAGEAQDQCYIVSELIRGGTLSHRMERHPLSAEEAIALVRQVADALHYAHSQGIIHRDVKPSNILIDAEGNAHLSDFGIAKVEKAGETTASRAGVVVGTPAYMSPEQASGRSDAADGRSDVYSLGIVLFELLTYGQQPEKSQRRNLLERIRRGDTSPFEIIEVEPERDIKAVCRKATSLQPEDRYATAAEFAAALSDLLREERAASTEMHKSRPHPALRVTVSAAIAVTVLLTASLFLAPRLAMPSNRVRVQITTEPAGAALTFIPLAQQTGVPLVQEARSVGRSPVNAALVPGKYLVVAVLDEDRFHEVYRTVPQPGVENRGGPFWHTFWQRQADGTILLPTVDIPAADVARGMRHFPGSENFRIGGNAREGQPQAWTRVPPFYADPLKANRKTFGERVGLEKLPARFTTRSAEERKPFEQDQAPLTYVSWDEAAHFAERAGMRLLDEVEYEFAVSAATTQTEDEAPPGDWLSGPGEWTSNWANSGPVGTNNQFVSSSAEHRVVRGLWTASGNHEETNDLEAVRQARVFLDQRDAQPDVGFRFARSTKPRLTAADFVRPSSVVSEKY